MAQSLIRVVYDGQTYDLDMAEDIPIRVEVSSIENTRIGNTFGAGSQVFTLPGTKNNNKFFKHGYSVGAQDIPGFYNSIPGFVIYGGGTLLDGQFQLIQVITDANGYVSYECRISDTVVKLSDTLGSSLIVDADWSDLDHALTYANISASWNNELLSGSVYYPLAQYGFDNPDNIQLPFFSFTGSNVGNYISNPLTPIQANQLLPAVRVKDTLDKIFSQAEFRYTGSFQNSAGFNDLYILPKPQDTLGVQAQADQIPTCFVSNTQNQVFTAPQSPTPLSFDLVSSDPLSKFNTSQGSYLADGIGDYTIQTNTIFFNPVTYTGATVTVTLRLMKGTYPSSGTTLASETVTISPSTSFTSFYRLNAGATFTNTGNNDIWATIEYQDTGGPTPGNLLLQGYSTDFQCTAGPGSVLGSTVDMGLQFQGETKSLDILNGLISQFNLVISPVKGQNNVVSIDTFDTWMRAGEIKNWTDRYDTADRIAINHTVDEQPKELLLKAADDSDRFSKNALESDPNYQYGTLRLLADNNLSQGEDTIGDYFAPVVLGGPFIPNTTGAGTSGDGSLQIDLNDNFIFPHLYKFENGKIASYAFTPRIGYKVTSPFNNTFYMGNTGGGATAFSGEYTTIANVSELPVESGVTKDILFNNTYTNFTATGNLDNTVTSFTTYWKTYLDSLYWQDSVKLTIDLEFNQYDYYNINLNDKIFIKDTFYRINKIKGYNLTNDDVTTVELIKLYPPYFTGIADCDMLVSGSNSDDTCVPGATPTPAPTSTPTATPNPGATPTPTAPLPPTPTANSPIPTPTLTPTATLPLTPTATPSTVYYARFITCGDPTGAVIQVSSTSPISAAQVISDGVDCYEFFSTGGTGTDGNILTYTSYGNCVACGVTPTPTPVPTSTPLPCQQILNIYGSTTSATDAYCVSTKQATAFFDASTLGAATKVYSDSNCTTLRATYTWYSDQTTIVRSWNPATQTLTTESLPACP